MGPKINPDIRVGFDIFEILRNEVDDKLIGMLTEPPMEDDNNATVSAKLLYSSCMNEGMGRYVLNFFCKICMLVSSGGRV